MINLHGVFPPIPTPFGPNGEVDYKALASNLKKWNATDLRGYLVLGSNGEFVSLGQDEKLRVLEVARENIPRDKVMIAGTGCESTMATIELTKAAARIGIDLVMVVTPSYFKPSMRSRELIAHYQAVADASPIPVLLYQVPQFTGVSFEPEAVATLVGHPNIVGMKDSSGVMATFAEFLRITPPDFQLLVGSATVFLVALALGAAGGILALANVAPRECVMLYELYKEGKNGEALELQLRLLPLARAVTTRFGIGGLKAALDILGYYGGLPRPPLLPPGPEDVKEMRRIIEEAGVL